MGNNSEKCEDCLYYIDKECSISQEADNCTIGAPLPLLVALWMNGVFE